MCGSWLPQLPPGMIGAHQLSHCFCCQLPVAFKRAASAHWLMALLQLFTCAGERSQAGGRAELQGIINRLPSPQISFCSTIPTGQQPGAKNWQKAALSGVVIYLCNSSTQKVKARGWETQGQLPQGHLPLYNESEARFGQMRPLKKTNKQIAQ